MGNTKRRTDSVASELAGYILTGNWPPGFKLPADDQLCARFRVSRTIIREAFRLLTGKGLLVARPRIGTLVAPKTQWSWLDADMLIWLDECDSLSAFTDDMADLRVAFEPSFAALAASRANESDNKTLQNCLRDLQQHPDISHECAFLSALYTASGNPMASGLIPLTRAAIKIRAGRPPLAAYARLTASIAQKDATAARAAIFQALLGA